jgi:DNA mismatch endonuclease (patch repair protein)
MTFSALAHFRPLWTSPMDRLTPERRSWNMSRIKGRDTGPEVRVRSVLHSLGFRFSLRRTDLPGKPDITLPKWQTVVFVHGCFWHQHQNCKNAVLPKTRAEFWTAKLTGNVVRDKRHALALRRMGWRVITIWECQAEDEAKLRRSLVLKLSRNNED